MTNSAERKEKGVIMGSIYTYEFQKIDFLSCIYIYLMYCTYISKYSTKI